LGRIADAFVRSTGDGEYEVVGTIELFEPNDAMLVKNETREMKIHHYPPDCLGISYDKGIKEEEELKVIGEIASYLKTHPQEEVKKSLDPLTIITLSAAFVLGGIAKGFLSKVGSDGYEALKRNLGRLFTRRRAAQDRVLSFQFTVTQGEYEIEVSTFLTNPTDADIEAFFSTGLGQLDAMVPLYFQPDKGVKKIVLFFCDGKVDFQFAIHKSCFPMRVVEKK